MKLTGDITLRKRKIKLNYSLIAFLIPFLGMLGVLTWGKGESSAQVKNYYATQGKNIFSKIAASMMTAAQSHSCFTIHFLIPSSRTTIAVLLIATVEICSASALLRIDTDAGRPLHPRNSPECQMPSMGTFASCAFQRKKMPAPAKIRYLPSPLMGSIRAI